MSEWKDPDEYRTDDDLVQVLAEVTQPITSRFPRSCEMPVSSGDHCVGDHFVSIGHGNEDGEWFVAGWEMTQDCWTDARCFSVVGWQKLATIESN